ncbi:MAG: sulfatase-like hydrolase/transferase [Bryobacteraceae bacterium]|nr:sulfatase-like hydrolase/transferase [Bryobacteraceae bacterium]
MQMTRRGLMESIAAPLLLQRRAAAQRPNIVLVLADGLPAWALGCYGNQEIRTPQIDRLAAAGTRMALFFASAPAGPPSRATLFTGRAPRQHGVTDLPEGEGQAPAAFAKEVLISDLLAGAGYRCGFAGLWGMGPAAGKPGHGFEFAAVLRSLSHEDPRLAVDGSEVQEKGYLPEILTKYAADFLARQQKDRPFFLVVSNLGPGGPLDGHPKRLLDLYASANFASFGIQPAAGNAAQGREHLDNPLPALRRYAAAVTALDEQAGALHRKILELGLFENTLFLFTSTHGALLGRHGLWGAGRASKPANLFEESIHVPMIWSWPGRVPTHSVRPELAGAADLLPALCEAAGVEPPGNRRLCGRSFLPLVMNRPMPKKDPWPDIVFAEFEDAEMARDKYYKLVVRGSGQGELYDIRKDPRERNNVYADAGFSTVRAHLEKKLAGWREACG